MMVILRYWLFALFLQALLASSAAATTLQAYRENVEQAAAKIERAIETAEDPVVEQQILQSVRTLMPREETVDWPGGSVSVSNDWLHLKLDGYAHETDTSKREEILNYIRERLAGIAVEVKQLEKATSAGPSKDEDKQKINEILQRPEFQKAPSPEESLFQRWLRQFDEWLKRAFPRSPAVPSSASAGIGSLKLWLQILVYAAVFGLVAFLLYRFLPFFQLRFGRRGAKENGDRVILGERIAANQSAVDLFAEAERLALEGDLRSAIRKGYIAMLCELSDRKVIGLATHKTNRDYLRDLSIRTDLLENMLGLTLNFERSWYGLRSPEPADWADFRLKYRATVGAVK